MSRAPLSAGEMGLLAACVALVLAWAIILATLGYLVITGTF